MDDLARHRIDILDRLAILDALSAALERRAEVMQAIWESEDSEAAVAAVRILLTCDEVAARAVLDMSWQRLTRQNRERIWQERDEQARHLADGWQ